MKEQIRYLIGIAGFIVGIIISSILDIILFGAIAAIPLAALVYLSIISQGMATALILWVAVIATIRVVIVSIINYLEQ